MTLGKFLNLSALPFPDLGNVNSTVPASYSGHELYVEYLEQVLAHTRLHMDVTYCYVQKLLHCCLLPLY